MLVAQITDPHVLAEGKLFHSPRGAIPADAEPGWSHIDTAGCLGRACLLEKQKPPAHLPLAA